MVYRIWKLFFWSYISLPEAAWRVPILVCLQVRIKRCLSRTDTQSENLQENRHGIKVTFGTFFSDTEGRLERLRVYFVFITQSFILLLTIKPPTSSQFLNGRLTIGDLKPKRLCAYGSKGFRLWELSKSKIRNYKAIDSSKKKIENNNQTSSK